MPSIRNDPKHQEYLYINLGITLGFEVPLSSGLAFTPHSSGLAFTLVVAAAVAMTGSSMIFLRHQSKRVRGSPTLSVFARS